MKVNKANKQKLIFVIVYLFCCLTMNSDRMVGYWGSYNSVFAFIKIAIVALAVAIVTHINHKDSVFVIKASTICTNSVLVLTVIDNYTLKLSGSLYLYRYWWLIYMYIAMFTMLITMTVIKHKPHKKFLNQFSLGICPIYIYTFIICFLRDPSKYERTINLIPFEGTFVMLKAFLQNPTGTFEPMLLFFGNLFVFMPAAFIVRSVLPKAKTSTILLIGILFPLFAEGYQYILACGDVDIDDVILNYIGYVMGFLIQKFIQKRLLPLR